MLSPTYAFDLDCDVESLLFQAEEHTAFTFEPLTPPQQQSRSYSVDDYYSRSNSTSSSYNSQVVIASNGFVIPNDQFSAYEFLLACSTNLASSQQQQTPETRPLPLQRPMPMLMPVIAPVMNPASPPMPTAMPAPRPVPMPIRSASGTCPTTPILPSHNCSYATTDNTNNATKATNLPARAASAPLMAALPSKPPKPKPVCVNCGARLRPPAVFSVQKN
ncbi:hypothetical protein HK100_005760 [Physocladia obscura]|uniref:Uncharacterized protein n=1 Tax=Physocladia obscura TaxID=109957 RepID=A0AAD5XFE3_9FUNG|nr:hypothetical protein HK100_005760 [Physocladia obscura]